MATLTYTDPKGQTQVFNVGDEAFITDIGGRPKYGKISNWKEWWFIDSRGITVKDLESGKYELTHMEPRPILTPEQIQQQNVAFASRNQGLGANMRETVYGGRRSRRRKSKKSRSRKYR